MYIRNLRAHQIRSFQQFDIQLVSGTNVFYGLNGVGKTTVLEAVDVLSRGKSFRCNRLREIISLYEQSFIVAAELVNVNDRTTLLAVEKSARTTELKIDRETVQRWSSLTEFLPVLVIHPESHRFVTGGPGERRKLLDWGLFHVEPSFKSMWRNYHRALRQRNLCLKEGNRAEARNWNIPLLQFGEQLNQLRMEYCREIIPIFCDIADKIGLKSSIVIEYLRGWPADQNLADVLDVDLSEKDLPITSRYGPHRAELDLRWNGSKFADTSSRGQQKLLSIALKLVQAKHLLDKANKATIYLIDELPAELDRDRCSSVLEYLQTLSSQILITSVLPDPLASVIRSGPMTKWFHVERGIVTTVV